MIGLLGNLPLFTGQDEITTTHEPNAKRLWKVVTMVALVSSESMYYENSVVSSACKPEFDHCVYSADDALLFASV